ncbi:MAG: Hsp20/alpha crystallin family protein [Betaproteobacteria bacterium]|nr:Hsp20/alpha crystallin family protein [Betaproteobacteria bacterium]
MANFARHDPYANLFEDIFKGFLVKPVAFESSGVVRKIRIEVVEQNSAYKVIAELPGAKKEEIQVTIEADQVSIATEIRQECNPKDAERVLHSERQFGRMQRVFRLGQEVDQGKTTATYADGLLELVLPIKAAADRRQITIN